MHCHACRRPLRNPISIQYGLGPDCLRRAVKAGNAPLEALTELAGWKRSKKRKQPAATEISATRDTLTMDLFAQPRKDAIGALYDAAEVARAFGIRVQLEIEE